MASARLAPLDPFAIKPAQPHADQVVGLPNSGRAPQGIAPAKKRKFSSIWLLLRLTYSSFPLQVLAPGRHSRYMCKARGANG